MREKVVVPACHSLSHGAFLVVDLLEDAEGEAFKPGRIVTGNPVSKPALNLAKRDFEAPAQRVFDCPVTPHHFREALHAEPERGQNSNASRS